MVVGACYHPPKPRYQEFDLSRLIIAGIEELEQQNPNSVIIFAGDLNQLDCNFLETQCGLVQVNHDATHGCNVLDKFFTNRPDLFISTTVTSSIKTKHKALIIRDVSVGQMPFPKVSEQKNI